MVEFFERICSNSEAEIAIPMYLMATELTIFEKVLTLGSSLDFSSFKTWDMQSTMAAKSCLRSDDDFRFKDLAAELYVVKVLKASFLFFSTASLKTEHPL